MMKFNDIKQNKILCCVVDNLEKCQSGWAREVSINLTDFLLHRFGHRGYDIYIDPDENALLKLAAEENFYTHAVVIASGTSFKLSDRIFDAIENKCKEDFFIAGHVLDRGERYYELHHQFYIVNLAQYRELEFPNIDQGDFFKEQEHIQLSPLRSEECLYEDPEVAEWIKPGNFTRVYNRKLHGWDIITTALKHDKALVDLGPAIRDNKQYLYYEYDHVFLKQVPELLYNQFFCMNFFAGWNSDEIRDRSEFTGPVDQYVSVGIGVNWIKNLEFLGTRNNTTVIFTDINYQCLEFMRKLVEIWDGKNYPGFYKRHRPILPNDSHLPENYFDHIEESWVKFIDTFDNWPATWNRIKQLNYKFVLLDYTSTYNFDWMDSNKTTFVNLSDVFTHVPMVVGLSLKYRIACENRFLENLVKKNPDINLLVSSRAADGFHPNTRLKRWGKVKDFELTDINVIKKPVWHLTDWSSTKILN